MKNRLHIYIAILLFVSSFNILTAQSLLDKLHLEEVKKTEKVESTFKTLRLGLGHSVETRKKGILEASWYTRFWNIPKIDGQVVENNNFGSDRASARYGFDYAISNDLSTGFGWDTRGIYDGYLKYRLLHQKTGKKPSPLSLTLLGSLTYRAKAINTILLNKDSVSIYNTAAIKTTVNKTNSFTDKVSYIGQLLIARKLNKRFSIQASPTLIYRGSTNFEEDNQLHLAVGFGGRYTLGKHVSLASQYFYVPNKYKLNSINTFGAFSLGVNWEVSKVQIQMFFSNTGNFNEDIYITETPVNFNTKDGNLFFGLNFSYVFHLIKNK